MWRGKELTGKSAKSFLPWSLCTTLLRRFEVLSNRKVARVKWFVPLVDPRVGLLQFADA